VAGYYPAAARATGLGWALGIGRLGAIAGPTYGALFVGTGSAVAAGCLAFAAPALLGALAMSGLPRRDRGTAPDPAPAPVADPAQLGSPA
jgi:AAHS family benzoate transporter-like MFS transporter